MPGFVSSARHASHLDRTLAVRGGAMRTFGGQAVFLTLGLLWLGFYLIRDQFVQPVASQSLSLFTAAFILATAMTLLYELIQLPKSLWRHAAEGRTLLAPHRASVVRIARRAARPRLEQCYGQRYYEQRANLPYQRSYVDRVRVRA